MRAIRSYKKATKVDLRVSPNARKTSVEGLHGDRIKIRLKAPPVDGKANRELVSYLATVLGARKSQCIVTHGLASRDKTVLITGVSVERIKLALQVS